MNPRRLQRLVGVGLVVSLIFLTAPALAQNQAVELEIQAGYDGRYVPGAWVPVSVVVESSRALRAVLEVASANIDRSSIVYSMNIEVPSGGRKQFNLVVPPPDFGRSLEAVIRADRKVLARRGTSLIESQNTTLVGVFAQPIPEAMRGSLSTSPLETEIRPVVVGEDLLSLGRRALEPLAYVVADAAEVGRLPALHRNSLFDWVITGGRLVVFADEPADIRWAPGRPRVEFGPGASITGGGDYPVRGGRGTIFQMGGGEFVVAGGSPESASRDAEFWRAAIRPPPLGHLGGREAFGFGFERNRDFELANELTRDRGSTVRLRWFVAFLIAYVVLVGPVNFIVLRRAGRTELSWVTIPAISLLFTGAAFAVTSGTRGGLAIRQGGAVLAASEGEAGRRIVTVSAGASGERSVGFGSFDAGIPWDFRGRARRFVTRVGARESTAVVANAPFSVGVARGGLEEVPGHLDAEITWNGKQYEASVTNRTPVKVSDITVLRGDISQGKIGDLAPGATGKVTIPERDPELGVMTAPTIWDETQSDFNLKRLLLGELRDIVRNRASVGMPIVLGFAEGLNPAVTIDGRQERPRGPLLIISAARLRLSPNFSGRVDHGAMHSEVVYLDGARVIGAPNNLRDDPDIVPISSFVKVGSSYRLPPNVDLNKIESVEVKGVVGGQGVVIVEAYDWSTGRWTTARADGNFKLNFPTSVISSEGEAYLRLGPEREPSGLAWGLEVVLQ